MSAGMPELGSKISLISKADIRYEGRLFTVDPQECTIALANVRSFGTEDREAECLVAPQNQIYDYILFRGSDIKDIRVVNNIGPLPNDPAIVQLSVPPSISSQPYQATGFTHPVLGHMGHGISPYQSYSGIGPIGNMPSGIAPGMGMYRDPRMIQKQPSELVHTVQIPELPQTNKDQDFIGGSRTTTPTLTTMARKSPTMDQGVQVSSSPSKDDKRAQQLPRKSQHGSVARTQVQHPREPFREQNPPREQHHKDPICDQRENVRDQRDVHARDKDLKDRDHTSKEVKDHISREQNRERDARDQHGHRGGWINRGAVRRGRGRGSVPGIGYNRQLQAAGASCKPKNTLKFENDYDFEQANTEFEELRTQLTKLKIDGVEVPVPENSTEVVITSSVTELKINGETDKKDDASHETTAGDVDVEEEQEVYYDKTKSFFDNISCEAVERSKGRSQRTDWRTERKLNSETFGVASARRGGFRGRGYYSRGISGGMYRGGYRSGYRGQNSRSGHRVGTNVMSAVTTQRPVTEVK